MSSIDKRIVEMGFENKGFEKGISESTKSLSGFNKALADSGNGSTFSGLQGVVDGVSGKFSALGTIATGVLLKIGSQIAEIGEKAVKFLVLDNITAGFGEYELKINSIKTMLASGKTKEGLPVTLEMVNSQLQKLNEYSDQTIYSFSDMTSNIGKFTNAGVDLETSVQAIQGISNAAALAGASSQDASRAMYNFSQALSAGYVKLIDWKSIENANMATVEFKTQLLESAVAAGTLTKTADGMYNVVGGGKNALPINATKGFNDSLQEQWMTTEVLTKTLGDYASSQTEIGRKANEAATKVRTFTQLIDTTKEALGSGWAESFELIFGDFAETTELWSGLSKVVGDIIGDSSDARNQILKDWEALGGRQSIIDGITAAWKNLNLILKPIRYAFQNVFPPLTGETLAKLSEGFKSLMESLKPSTKTLLKLQTIFQGLFSAMSLGWQALTSAFDIIKTAITSLLPEGDGVLGFATKIGQFFIDLKDSADKGNFFAEKVQIIKDGITGISDKIKEVASNFTLGAGIPAAVKSITDSFTNWPNSFPGFEGFGEKLSNFFTPIKEILEPIGTFLVELFASIKTALAEKWATEGFSGFVDIIKTILSGGILLGLKDLISTFTGMAGSADSIASGFSGIFGGIQTILKSYQENLKATKLISIAAAIALLAASVIGLSMVDPVKMSNAITALTLIFVELSGSFMIMEKSMSGTAISKMGGQLFAISASVLLISFALQKIASIPADKLSSSILGLSAILLELVVVSKLMQNTKSFTGAAVGLMAMGVAINIIVLAVKALGKMDAENLKQGLIAVGLIAAGMAIFAISISQLSKGGNLLAAAAAIGLIAVGILEMTGIVALLGSINPDNLARGLFGLGMILGEILAFSIIISNTINPVKLLAAAAAMTMMGVAILEISGVVAILGNMDADKLGQGLIGLAASMTVMVASMLLLANPSVLVGAAAMIVMAGAIAILTPSIIALGAVPLENIGKSLLTLAGVFTVIGLAALVLTPVIPQIFALSAAIALLGVGLLAVGGGMALFGVGLTALSSGGTAAIGLLVIAIKEIVMLLPFILTKVGESIVALAGVIITGAPLIAKAIVAVASSLIVLLSGEIPKLITVVLKFIGELLIQLVDKVPEFVDAGMKIILGFLKGVSDNIQAIVETVIQMLANILEGIAAKIPELIKAGADIIIAFLDGIGEQIPRVVEAAFNMIIDFINGLATSIRDNTPLLLTAVAGLCTAFLDGVLTFFGISGGDSTEGQGVASSIVQGLITGIGDGVEKAVKAIVDFAGKILQGIKDFFGIASPSTVMTGIGGDLTTGLGEGVTGGQESVLTIIGTLLTSMLTKITESLGEFLTKGGEFVSNLVSGIQGKLADLSAAGTEMLTNVWNGISAWWATFTTNISTTFGTVGATISTAVATLVDKGAEIVTNVWNGVSTAWTTFTTNISTTFGTIGSAITTAITGLYDIGANIVAGVWEGISGAFSGFMADVGGLFSGIATGVKDILGIQSPSTVFEDIGVNIQAGLSSGIEKATNADRILEAQLGKLLAAAEKFISEFKQTGYRIGSGFVTGLQDGFGSSFSSVEQKIKSAMVILISGLKAVSIDSNSMNNIGMGLAKGLETGFNNTVPALKSSFQSSINSVISGLSSLIVGASNITAIGAGLVSGLKTGFNSNLSSFMSLIGTLPSSISNTLSNPMFETGKYLLNEVWLGIYNAWDKFVQNVQDKFTLLYTLIGAVIGNVNSIGDEISIGIQQHLSASAETFLYPACAAIVSNVHSALSELSNTSQYGSQAANGVANGIRAGIPNAVAAAIDLANAVNNAFASTLEIESPSKVFEQLAKRIPEGVAVGINENTKVATNAVGLMAKKLALVDLSSSMTKILNALDTEMNLSPTISPVLNLDNVRAGSNILNNLLNSGENYDMAVSGIIRNQSAISDNQNGSGSNTTTDQSVKNEFNLYGLTIRTEADIDKIASKLYRKQEDAMRSRGIRPSYA